MQAAASRCQYYNHIYALIFQYVYMVYSLQEINDGNRLMKKTALL